MLERGKISAFQMGILIYPTILATAILLVPGITAKYAQQDMWISPIWASLMGYLTVYIACRLHKLYPKKTIIQYSQQILGFLPGKIIGLIFLFFYLYGCGIIVRQYGEFVVGVFLKQTPLILVMGSLMLACACAVRAGVEILGRTAEMIVPILILFIILVLILLLPDVEVKHILPIMDKGILPSLRGAIIPQTWFNELFLITFLLPFLMDQEKAFKWGMISVHAVMLTMVATNLVVLMIFGRITDRLLYPVMDAVRYISIADFLEHLEVIIMAIWVAGVFVKLCLIYYALALGTAQWLNLSDYRPIVFPLGILAVTFGIWSASNLAELTYYLGTSGVFYRISIHFCIPLFLLLAAYIQKELRKKKRAS